MAKKDDMTISRADLEAARKEILALDGEGFWADLAKTLEDIAYQGFDPLYIYSLLKKRAAAHGRDLNKDMNLLAAAFAMRGTKLKKIIGKSKQHTAELLTKLQSTYGITDTASTGGTIGASIITLGRIGAIFSVPIIHAFASGKVNTVVQDIGVDDFPLAMFCPVFAALIPKKGGALAEQDITLLIHAYLWHQYCFDRIINSKRDKSAKEKLFQFVDIQMNNSIYDEEFRMGELIKLGIIMMDDGKPVIDPEIVVALAAAQKKFSAAPDFGVTPAGTLKGTSSQ